MRVWLWVALMLVWNVSCTPDAGPHYCNSDSECGAGMVCGSEDCAGIYHCLKAGCACEPGGFHNPCSADFPPDPCNCDHATCDHPFDSCDKSVCPGVCNLGDSCQFCTEHDGCEYAEPCLSATCLLDGAGQAACRSSECFSESVRPPLCGSPNAPCGACFEPHCDGVECGIDGLTGLSCGTCPVHQYCAGDQHCVLPGVYSLCQGDLAATPPLITAGQLATTPAQPMGGTISDGIYDLVAEYEYGFGVGDEYDRAALRLFDGATHAEHIYDANLESFTEHDSPHRLMNVSRTGTTLTFDVTCPDKYVLFPHYTREYTVDGNQLWLFQQSTLEVYERRP